MKALVVRQPWANWIAIGKKTVETRTWTTKYRGPLLIVAGKALDTAALARVGGGAFPRGAAIAIVKLVNVTTMNEVHETAAMVPCRPGLYAWTIELVTVLDPFEVKGRLGLFDVDINEEVGGVEDYPANEGGSGAIL